MALRLIVQPTLPRFLNLELLTNSTLIITRALTELAGKVGLVICLFIRSQSVPYRSQLFIVNRTDVLSMEMSSIISPTTGFVTRFVLCSMSGNGVYCDSCYRFCNCYLLQKNSLQQVTAMGLLSVRQS